jgi:hypothetical protein
MKKTSVVFIALMSISQFSMAEPFGLNMGASYEELSRQFKLESSNNPYVYTTAHPPKEHSSFDDYMLVIAKAV